ncbi:HD domain-containing protein [Cellulomonas sp. Leaf334]|uniref:HD domain-containing protein n=1 Tax=Cellulomonas sp. Leaf334 TaxID=1736339 RepID=UPI0012E13A2F|nr:HD domain-containing protein [Cellulomonas sp. Leaf334]
MARRASLAAALATAPPQDASEAQEERLTLSVGTLDAAGHRDLGPSLLRVEEYVERWWADNPMPWFTDHGPGHSRRVADYALEIASIPGLPQQFALSPLERYVLWVSAWLHDLGMQSLGQPLGPITPQHQATIRHRHPDESASVILEGAQAIGLPADNALIQVVAYVARAHGTEFFESSCTFLRSMSDVRNERVRGPLLGSILLIADELDLHYERARPSLAHPTLNHVSEAHAIKHRHVLACRVQHRPGGSVGFALTTQALKGFPELDALAVEQWIVDKLRRQVAMVEVEFSGGFGSHASLSRAITVSRVPAVLQGAAPDPLAMAVIRADNARDRMLDHVRELADVLGAISARQPIAIIGPLDDSFVDLSGREDLLDAAEARLAGEGTRVIASRSIYNSLGAATIADIISEWERAAGVDPRSIAAVANSNDRLDNIIHKLSESTAAAIVTVSSCDRLDGREFEWLLQTALRRMRDELDASIVISVEPGARQRVEQFGFASASTIALDQDEVSRDLVRYMDADSAESAAEAQLGYAALKRLRDQYLLRLSGVPS